MAKGKSTYRCSEADMRAAVAAYLRQFGPNRFHLPAGPMGVVLSETGVEGPQFQRLGWVWMPRPECCLITEHGHKAVADHLPRLSQVASDLLPPEEENRP
jgi:hypothetical protein